MLIDGPGESISMLGPMGMSSSMTALINADFKTCIIYNSSFYLLFRLRQA